VLSGVVIAINGEIAISTECVIAIMCASDSYLIRGSDLDSYVKLDSCDSILSKDDSMLSQPSQIR
jgi:hypothetical protein